VINPESLGVGAPSAMKEVTTEGEVSSAAGDVFSQFFDDWFDPIESGIRRHVRGLIEAMIEAE
jgi:hypothetical protein